MDLGVYLKQEVYIIVIVTPQFLLYLQTVNPKIAAKMTCPGKSHISSLNNVQDPQIKRKSRITSSALMCGKVVTIPQIIRPQKFAPPIIGTNIKAPSPGSIKTSFALASRIPKN